MNQQSGAVGACWAHNPEVDGSKPSSANFFFSKRNTFSLRFILFPSLQLPQDLELVWNRKLRTTAGFCRNSGWVEQPNHLQFG